MAEKSSFEITRTLRGLEKYTSRLLKRMNIALEECAIHILAASQELVPVDTGALKLSGRVEEDRGSLGYRRTFGATGTTFSYRVVYGGRASGGIMGVAGADVHVDYAVIVHERMEVYHKPPTQAKYLEQAVYRNRPEMNAIIRDMMAAREIV
jgi:hypothetical protein